MKEEDIRPKKNMLEEKRLRAEDIKHLMERKNEFVKIPCPACESDENRFKFSKEGFNFNECAKCSTLFINPRPTRDMLSEYYTASKSIKYWNDNIFPASENTRREQIFVPRAKKVIELCKKFGVTTDTIVDIGAGFGTFMEEINKLNVFKRAVVIEPSPDLAETCRRKGLEVIESTIEDAKLSGANVITNFELIEHLFWPKDFLFACSKILSKGGVFILTTPNIKGFDLLTLGELSDNIEGPNHLNYFHPDSLSRLLEVCGFEVVEVLTPGKLDAEIVREKILAGKLDISKSPFLRNTLIDQWETKGEIFQCFLAENNLSSHLWIVTRKV
ncbi:methyltransferase type 11 [Candidatus Giovannonibacteria bacterium RIFCSPHIGHO2_01_FULL_45_33]|uniref:Methyltransferase type 11 n=1 Tax=Candidatus Giovannonibacteria bacterium RIFCSPLOWO2_01_FULL_45_34 TaxID=1798351 RepID=A0A1F5WYH3_9BACT|nr:MAG: methyltransferase type 11 [Candidatus Giovannonibacteria bacterium RIFCSPHIGHO2_01_FULL_45_33]OGF70975.1 MAG: methyltransferase type 11 [Candidatus Giovannonibacteria bacterium RIFCSPHIGHO2_02_FULL_44_11]OGF80694.1 MAG: methyltransferase type 11 [Candidatus Giovannonibacteria bacterium RIFCSPLOWO2_01_FULL_45_34]